MSENRYTILIGINDYEKQELHFCDKDVESIKQRLVNNCLFEKDKIFELVSTKTSSICEMYLSLIEVMAQIAKEFITNEDAITFYFSGHG